MSLRDGGVPIRKVARPIGEDYEIGKSGDAFYAMAFREFSV